MDEEPDKSISTTINVLPNELIIMILRNNNYREISRFGITCKRFNDMVNNSQCLWKKEIKYIVPKEIFLTVANNCEGDWLTEIKWFVRLKQKIYSELNAMSSQYYKRTGDVTLEDVRHFFAIALTNNISFYCTIYILQQLVIQARKTLDALECEQPFTMTEMFYAKVVLRHLLHTYLAMKWVKAHVKNELTPEIVVNFFLQWVDTDNLYPDEDIECRITDLAKKVEALLEKKSTTDSIKEQLAKGLIKENKVLAAVTQVLYQQRHIMAITSAVNLDTLNINKVLDYKFGNIIVIAAIYQAVARKLGVKCNLIVFPNHLILEWKDNSDHRSPVVYTIDLASGELQPKRQCPFARNDETTNYKYYPDSLMQYIYSAFHLSMGAIKNWNTQNALHLLDFLGTYDNEYNPYRNFLPYLLDLTHLPGMNMPLDLKHLSDLHLPILNSLSNLNTPYQTVNRNMEVKARTDWVKFAVGMICYHTKYNYVCIIRGWDLTCAIKWETSRGTEILGFGPHQPFYHVIAADQSERYVAQENLTEVASPTRLIHLEDMIAREFTHFNGFAYALNEEKKIEYPNEEAISNLFRERCALKLPVMFS